MKQTRMKYVVTNPEIVLLVVTIVILALFDSIYPIKVPRKPVFANPDTLIVRPNSAGTYQQWSTFGSPPSHWQGTSDQKDTSGVQVTGSTTLKETENLQDTTQTGTMNSVTTYICAKSNSSSEVNKLCVIATFATVMMVFIAEALDNFYFLLACMHREQYSYDVWSAQYKWGYWNFRLQVLWFIFWTAMIFVVWKLALGKGR